MSLKGAELEGIRLLFGSQCLRLVHKWHDAAGTLYAQLLPAIPAVEVLHPLNQLCI